MLSIYLNTFISVLIVSAISLIGIFALMLPRSNLNRLTMMLVSLSAGALLGDSFLHLIPEAAEKNNASSTWLWLLAGIIIFFILEKVIHWRHCHLPTNTSHPHPVGLMNLIGDGLHNFTDGIAIAGSFLIDYRLGLATTIAVISHEIPGELGDFAVLIYAGYSRFKAVVYNFVSAIAAVVGALLTLIIGSRIENITDYVIPLAAGGFIYIAASDLFPELKKDCPVLSESFLQLIFILLGIGIMLALKMLD